MHPWPVEDTYHPARSSHIREGRCLPIVSHKLSHLDETQTENFKWDDGESKWGRGEAKAQNTLHSPSFPPKAPPSLLFSRGVIIVNHLITEARANPRFWARWKVSRRAPQTLSRQQIKADALWWSYTMLLWYCSAQRSAGFGWMTKFDRIFQPIPLPSPFKVTQKAALIMRAFMSGCFVVRGQVNVPHSPCCHEREYTALKELNCKALCVRGVWSQCYNYPGITANFSCFWKAWDVHNIKQKPVASLCFFLWDCSNNKRLFCARRFIQKQRIYDLHQHQRRWSGCLVDIQSFPFYTGSHPEACLTKALQLQSQIASPGSNLMVQRFESPSFLQPSYRCYQDITLGQSFSTKISVRHKKTEHSVGFQHKWING